LAQAIGAPQRVNSSRSTVWAEAMRGASSASWSAISLASSMMPLIAAQVTVMGLWPGIWKTFSRRWICVLV